MTDDMTPYLDSIRRWDPTIDLTNARVDPNGLNNLVIIAADTVFRFPRSEKSRAKLRVEADLLAVVHRHVQTPTPLFTFDDTDDMVVYPLVPGRPTFRHDLLRRPEPMQAEFAAGIGTFLSQLHAIPADSLAAVNLVEREDQPNAAWLDRLEAVRTELYPYLWADQRAWIEDLFAPLSDGRLDMSAFAPCLIHNDLASYHLLSDPDSGALSGVLDFGSAQWGDPAADLATLISGYGESFLQQVTATYPITAAVLERARVRAGYLELEWARRGLAGADPEWYLVHLGRSRDMRPFGLPL